MAIVCLNRVGTETLAGRNGLIGWEMLITGFWMRSLRIEACVFEWLAGPVGAIFGNGRFG